MVVDAAGFQNGDVAAALTVIHDAASAPTIVEPQGGDSPSGINDEAVTGHRRRRHPSLLLGTRIIEAHGQVPGPDPAGAKNLLQPSPTGVGGQKKGWTEENIRWFRRDELQDIWTAPESFVLMRYLISMTPMIHNRFQVQQDHIDAVETPSRSRTSSRGDPPVFVTDS